MPVHVVERPLETVVLGAGHTRSAPRGLPIGVPARAPSVTAAVRAAKRSLPENMRETNYTSAHTESARAIAPTATAITRPMTPPSRACQLGVPDATGCTPQAARSERPSGGAPFSRVHPPSSSASGSGRTRAPIGSGPRWQPSRLDEGRRTPTAMTSTNTIPHGHVPLHSAGPSVTSTTRSREGTSRPPVLSGPTMRRTVRIIALVVLFASRSPRCIRLPYYESDQGPANDVGPLDRRADVPR